MEDKDTQAYRTAITNLKIVSMPITPTGPTLLCDVSTGKPRPIVPSSFRRQVFEVAHNLFTPRQKNHTKTHISKVRLALFKETGQSVGERVRKMSVIQDSAARTCTLRDIQCA